MRQQLTRIGKLVSILVLLTIIICSSASTPGIKSYENDVLRSIKEKFKVFYSQAPQDRIYVQTDKPFYKPGETVCFTAYVRDGETFKPSDNSDIIHVEFITPKGTTERHYKIVAKDGAARGDFDLSGHPGGIYKIRAYTEFQKNEDSLLRFEKDITVQSVVMPRLKMKLDFEKKAYGKGDEVIAKLELNTNANKPLANTNVRFKAQLDGKDLSTDSAITDANGKVSLRFKLPNTLNSIDGVVNAMIDFEGSTESVSRSIPIVLNKIKLDLFPEGGDMVNDCKSRVAFRATNEFGKPADIEGMIVDSKGAFVCQFSSFHFGMGEFEITPKPNESYRARITKPVGILDEYNLPIALNAGYILRVAEQSENNLKLAVQSTHPEELSYIAQTRGKIYASGSFKAIKGANALSVNTTDFPIGISQITLFDSTGIERCERLVFVHKNKQLKISVSTDKPQYKPREKVSMDIKVTDENGLPVQGNFSLSVIDDNLLSFADDRQGNILSKMLLEPDLKQKVEEPNFYFDTKEPKSDKALDLLMLTSGWRHYVWKKIINADFPTTKYKGEKAEIAGVISDRSSRKPIAGAVVRLAQSDRAVITDHDGKYHFRNVDIATGEELNVSAPYYREQKSRVYNYSTTSNFLLYSDQSPLEAESSPGKMNYQVVIQDVAGQPLRANQKIALRFKVHAGAALGRVIFEETDTALTDKYGMINTYIGQKRKLKVISTVKGDKYLDVEVNAAGLNNYKKLGKPALLPGPIAFADSVMPTVVVIGAKYERRMAEETVSMDVVSYKKPLMDKADAPPIPIPLRGKDAKIEQAMTRDDIKNQGALEVGNVVTMREGVVQNDAGQPLTINGGREDEVQYVVRGHRIMAEAADMADMAPNPKIIDPNLPQANAKFGDDRTSGFAAFQKKSEEQGKQVIFYRAKEYPIRKYEPTDTVRNDFASTLYWNGNVVTDKTGKAKLSFITNDLISSFKTTVEGFGLNGSVGRAEYNFSTNLPFAMDAKIPVELVSGDNVMIPVFLKNSTTSVINGKVQITPPQQLALQSTSEDVLLPANSSKVVYIHATATNEIGDGTLAIKFTSEKYNDAITRIITIAPKGFPATISFSGQELSKQIAVHPENVVPGSMKVTFTAYPNIMGELMSGIASILREPNGCFEQTSSSNYPNILALQYLKTMQVKDEATETRAMAMLDKGYKKLTSFETKDNGYEWFGVVPPHEALTAYGLMEFVDMKNVYSSVDQSMIDRTANLLLARRDGEGGFKKNPKALDAFGKADDDVTNAYIVYSLCEAGYKDKVKKELDEVYKNAKGGDDPYILALTANALFDAEDKRRGDELNSHLLSLKDGDGVWTGKKHSITRSTGKGLKVETSSLVLMGMMKSQNPDIPAMTNVVKFLIASRSGRGDFGSTQATILALKALTRFAEYSRKTDEAGAIEIFANDISIAHKDYAKGERNNIVLDGLEKYIGDGKQKIEVRFNGCKQALPYAMNISYNTSVPSSAKECVIDISTKLSSTQVKVGETVRLSATVTNKTATGQPMTMAIIGLPAGLSAQPWQLKEMQEKGVIDFYEINGNNIAFYYRSLPPNAEKQINLDLKAEIPGEYDAPASSAYLYYTNELKSWVALNKITVKTM